MRDAHAALERLLHSPQLVSRRRRAASILLPGSLLVLQALGVAVALGMMRQAPFDPILLAALAVYGRISMLTAWIARGGLVLRAWGIGVSETGGSSVSALRAMLRSALAWIPMFAASAPTGRRNPPRVRLSCWD